MQLIHICTYLYGSLRRAARAPPRNPRRDFAASETIPNREWLQTKPTLEDVLAPILRAHSTQVLPRPMLMGCDWRYRIAARARSQGALLLRCCCEFKTGSQCDGFVFITLSLAMPDGVWSHNGSLKTKPSNSLKKSLERESMRPKTANAWPTLGPSPKGATLVPALGANTAAPSLIYAQTTMHLTCASQIKAILRTCDISTLRMSFKTPSSYICCRFAIISLQSYSSVMKRSLIRRGS